MGIPRDYEVEAEVEMSQETSHVFHVSSVDFNA